MAAFNILGDDRRSEGASHHNLRDGNHTAGRLKGDRGHARDDRVSGKGERYSTKQGQNSKNSAQLDRIEISNTNTSAKCKTFFVVVFYRTFLFGRAG